MQSALLVCEGACNGGLVQAFDEAVSRETAVSPEQLGRARRFKYTRHCFVRRDLVQTGSQSHHNVIFGCGVCGQERMFGKEVPGV
jgi:hypothetical protein